jgi:hypothetical protein
MALTQRHIGDTFSAVNQIVVDVVVPGLLVYSTAGGNVTADLGAGGGWGLTVLTAAATGIVSWSGSDNGIYTS